MAIIGNNNNRLYVDSSSSEFRIAVNNVDTWRYNYNNGALRQAYQPCIQANMTYGYGNPGNNAVITWNTSSPGGYRGPASIIATANRFTAPQTGIYKATWTMLSLYNNEIWIAINGSRWYSGAHLVTNSGSHYSSIGSSAVINMNAGDFIEFRVNSNGYNMYANGWSMANVERLG